MPEVEKVIRRQCEYFFLPRQAPTSTDAILGVAPEELGISLDELQEFRDIYISKGGQDGFINPDVIESVLVERGIIDTPREDLQAFTEAISVVEQGKSKISFRAFAQFFTILRQSASLNSEGLNRTARGAQITTCTRRPYLESGHLTQDEAILQFVRTLESHRAACVKEYKYLEAQSTTARLKEVMAQEESKRWEEMRARQAGQRLDVERAFAQEQAQQKKYWDSKAEELDKAFTAQMSRLKSAHTKKLEEFQASIREKEPQRPQFSRDLLNQRRIQDCLAKQGQYLEANALKNAADQLEGVELEATLACYNNEAQLKLQQLKSRQDHEVQALLQRVQRSRAELEQARCQDSEKRMQRYKNFVSELESIHRMESVQLGSFLEKKSKAGKRPNVSLAVETPWPSINV